MTIRQRNAFCAFEVGIHHRLDWAGFLLPNSARVVGISADHSWARFLVARGLSPVKSRVIRKYGDDCGW
jgi:hypothetical protein